MLPEALEIALSRNPSWRNDEDFVNGSLSIPYINKAFTEKIARMRQDVPLYKKIKSRWYYVLPSSSVIQQPQLVRGKVFLSFIVAVSPLATLKKKVLVQGVPEEDRQAFSVALEEQFNKEVRLTESRIEQYREHIGALQDLATVDTNILLELYNRIYEARALHIRRIRYPVSLSQGEKDGRQLAVKEQNIQLRVLTKYLLQRGSL